MSGAPDDAVDPVSTREGSAGERLVSRLPHYLVYVALFGVVYGALAVTGRFPRWLLFGLLVVSLVKDGYDEYRIRTGRGPLAYAGIEHAPSDAVLLALLLGGVLSPPGAVLGLAAGRWAVLLAVVDLVFDLSQDARA